MKLLHAVVRLCVEHARDATRRGALTVPHDFRVTVPAPLAGTHAVDSGTMHERQASTLRAASTYRIPATALVSTRH